MEVCGRSGQASHVYRRRCHRSALLLGVLIVPGFARAAVMIAEQGVARAVIVHNGNTALPDEMAGCKDIKTIKPPVETLNGYLKRITGVELPVVATLAEAGARTAIVLELVDKVPGASEKPTGRQAYRLRTDGTRLILTAASELGLTYAVYGLLEDHLGCRFYTYQAKGLSYGGPGFEVVPRQPTLALDKLEDLQEPVFAQRGFIYWPGSYPWVLQNRGAGSPADTVSGGLGVSLNMYALLPPHDTKIGREEVKGLFAEHPDFYPLTTACESPASLRRASLPIRNLGCRVRRGSARAGCWRCRTRRSPRWPSKAAASLKCWT